MSENTNPMSEKTVEQSLNVIANLATQLEKTRRQKRNLSIAVLLMAAGGILSASIGAKSAFSGAEDPSDAKNTAALVRIEGAIMPGGNTNAARINPLLERAFKDKQSSAVILVVNSPGGTPVQSNLIRTKITELQASQKKPVVVVGEDVVASGAYLISVAAERIFIDPTSVVGSIGVISKGFGFTGLMDKIGVERRVQTAGTAKNMGDPFSPVTDEQKGVQQQMLDDIHQVFISAVKDGRKVALKYETPGLFSGSVFVGQNAVNVGLADELGNLEEAKKYLGVTKVRTFQDDRLGLLSKLSALGVSTAASAAQAAVTAQESQSGLPLATFNGE